MIDRIRGGAASALAVAAALLTAASLAQAVPVQGQAVPPQAPGSAGGGVLPVLGGAPSFVDVVAQWPTPTPTPTSTPTPPAASGPHGAPARQASAPAAAGPLERALARRSEGNTVLLFLAGLASIGLLALRRTWARR